MEQWQILILEIDFSILGSFHLMHRVETRNPEILGSLKTV